jgi:pSer/pThr/pTyr-binding forkhead associated (FHA) protein
MIRYTVYFNGEQVKVYDIEEPVIFIGRLPENQIPIFNMGISRRHVKIELDASGSYTLTDLNSLNGTLVNGKKVKKATLSNGDKITIGKYTIVYEDLRGEAALHLETIVAEFRPEDMQQQRIPQTAGPQTPLPPAAPQMMPPPVVAPLQAVPPPPSAAVPPQAAPLPYIPAPAQQPPLSIPLTPAPAPAPQPQPQAAPPPNAANDDDDEALSGAVLIETAGHIVYKLDHDYLTIGSDESDDIYAAGFMVNKSFAAIEKRDGGFYITAQKMMAKIKVNGKSVRTHRLEHRDRIEIGSNTFRFMENG